jgi:hypothetical protein
MGIDPGDEVAFVDRRGITWFGVAVTGIRHIGRWPTVGVKIAGRVVEVPARDVDCWPAVRSGRQSGKCELDMI